MSISEASPEITIGVMGPTGTGKSSFIQLITGDQNIIVGHDVESETTDIGLARCVHSNGLAITLVDTPGFDDSREERGDAVILQHIATYLEAEFQAGKKLSGIIYLHRITDPRMGGITSRNLRMFRNLCGTTSLKNVVVVTTRWDALVTQEEGIRRENNLMTNQKFFKPLIDAGATFLRHNNTIESAQKIMEALIHSDPVPLQIQVEITEGKSLGDTAAGSVLGDDIRRKLERQENELVRLRSELRTAMENKDDIWKMELEEEKIKIRKEIEKVTFEKNILEESLEKLKDEAEALKEAMSKQLEEQRRSISKDLSIQKDKWNNFAAHIKETQDKYDSSQHSAPTSDSPLKQETQDQNSSGIAAGEVERSLHQSRQENTAQLGMSPTGVTSTDSQIGERYRHWNLLNIVHSGGLRLVRSVLHR